MRLFKANQTPPSAEELAVVERLLALAARSKAQAAPDLTDERPSDQPASEPPASQ